MNDPTLRRLVLAVLDGGRAHATAKAVLDGFPVHLAGHRPPGVQHSAWQLLEHLRIAQADILRYCIDEDYEAPKWPDDYWPESPEPPSAAAWRKSAREFRDALAACNQLVAVPQLDLLADLPYVPDVTWLQELFLIANHNSYHLGQLMQLRRQLEATEVQPAKRRARR